MPENYTTSHNAELNQMKDNTLDARNANQRKKHNVGFENGTIKTPFGFKIIECINRKRKKYGVIKVEVVKMVVQLILTHERN